VQRTFSRTGSIVLLALVACLVLGATAVDAGAETSANAGAKTASADTGTKTSRRAQMLELINAEREARGIATLDASPRVRRYAHHHSRAMARRGYLFHTASLAKQLQGIHWSIAGENVGSGGELDVLFDAFMDSTPHRKNILRASFHRVGIGIVERHGSLWVTMVFYG
jgi:uncharacterized protein YkwD